MERYYYPRTIKGITVALMDVFNGIKVYKYDANGTSAQEIDVPLQFGPIEKAQQDRIENHYYDNDNVEHGNRFYLQIPRMSITMDDISYNADRAYGVNEWRYWLGEATQLSNIDQVFSDYQPTPYDIGFTLHVMTDSLDYFSQILENVLPYFNPKLFLRVKEFSFLNLERDLPVEITSISPDFIDQMTETDTRYVNVSLSMRVEAFMYRPWTQSKIIKFINTNFWVGNGNVDSSSTNLTDTSASSFVNAYSISGVEITSAGDFNPTSAVPDNEEFILSGDYEDTNKHYGWFLGTSQSAHGG